MLPAWVHQTNQPGIGDFVRICPTIQTQAIKQGCPVPVFFDNKEIQEAFSTSPYIQTLHSQPSHQPLFSTRLILNMNIRYDKTRNKYKGVHFTFHGDENHPPPYIEAISAYGLPKKHVAVFNGLGYAKGFYKLNKDIGWVNRQYIINRLLVHGYTPVILGTQRDRENFWQQNDLRHCVDLLGKLRLAQTISVINECESFISNDTALYHFASALGKKGLVLWLDTFYEIDANLLDKDRVRHYQSRDRKTYPAIIEDYLLGIA